MRILRPIDNCAHDAPRVLSAARGRRGAPLDARVGSERIARARDRARSIPPGADPVRVARRWLEGQHTLDAAVRERAQRALGVAERFHGELDHVARRTAEESAQRGSTPSLVHLSQIDSMSSTLARFSSDLRTLLEHASSDPETVARQLDIAIDAAEQHDGGLPALVVALSTR